MSRARYGAGPPVSIKATGTILNPWYDLPYVPRIIGPDGVGSGETLEITSRCRVDLSTYSLKLFFQDDALILVFLGDSLAARYWVDPIRYLLTYRTFINYNLIGPSTPPHEEAFEHVDTIRFRVERIVRREVEETIGGKVQKYFYHTGEEEWLEVTRQEILQYLCVLNPTLYYALAFYLVGCDHPRYFLIEYYKAVEVIKNAFGTQRDFLCALRRYGVRRRAYREFTEICNDSRRAPLDIGRHAPELGAPLYSVDLRNLLVQPRSREVLESATIFCRQVIDAYLQFLIE